MNKKVVIHVGPPKTGTSVLQNWFNSNHLLLAEHGVFYPKHKVDQNGVSSGNKDIFLSHNKSSNLLFNDGNFLALIEEFEKSKCHTLLLSSEFFFSNIPNFMKFRNRVEMEFVAYVRPEYEFIESIYNQSVKRNRQTSPLQCRTSLPHSYLDRLSEYIDTYGSDYFHLRAYGINDFFEKGIVADFVNVLKMPSELCEESNNNYINSSYSFECLEFKRWLNQFDLQGEDRRLDACLQGYDKGIKRYTVIPSSVHEVYKRQSKCKITALNDKAGIQNYLLLLEYINSTARDDYYHQDLYLSHVEHVTKFCVEKDAHFFQSLIKKIEPQLSSEVDQERFNKMVEVFNSTHTRNKDLSSSFSFKAFFSYVKNKLGK